MDGIMCDDNYSRIRIKRVRDGTECAVAMK